MSQWKIKKGKTVVGTLTRGHEGLSLSTTDRTVRGLYIKATEEGIPMMSGGVLENGARFDGMRIVKATSRMISPIIMALEDAGYFVDLQLERQR